MKYKQVKIREFNQIKALLKMDGMNTTRVAKFTGRSFPTVNFIRKAEKFADYHTQKETTPKVDVASSNGKTNKEHTPTLVVDANVVKLLARIAESLELMEGHWRTSSVKKRNFLGR